MTMSSAFLVASRLASNRCSVSHSSYSLFKSELVAMVLIQRSLELLCKLLFITRLPVIDLKVSSLARLPSERRPG